MTKKTHGVLIDGTPYSKTWSSLVLFSMVFYVASYATGLGNVPWQQAELFNLDGRITSLRTLDLRQTDAGDGDSPRDRHVSGDGDELDR